MSLLCRLGIHQHSTDAAEFSSATMCWRCGKYIKASEAWRLATERELWGATEHLTGYDYSERRAWVQAALDGAVNARYSGNPAKIAGTPTMLKRLVTELSLQWNGQVLVFRENREDGRQPVGTAATMERALAECRYKNGIYELTTFGKPS